ncbi:MAG: hypothetical protein ABIP53_05750 [Candidatus Limnocylindrales bacterium]
MESTFGREVQLDAARHKPGELVSHAAEQVRGLVKSLVDGNSDSSGDDIMNALAMAILEAQ